MGLDTIDKKILDLIQSGIPVEPRPFRTIAERAGITENEAVARVQQLNDEGVIRRLGISVSPAKAGYTTTLVAANIHGESLEKVIERINSYPQITHNYERDDDLNVWFTIIAQDRFEIENILSDISSQDGVRELLELPALTFFKLDVRFSYSDGDDNQ
ncbi:MAG: AsnC family transcriptional regulator [Chitinivibrionales bacterium]|nr:AsnC family transcriptional regulator [Chitinivibrionales bacterium]